MNLFRTENFFLKGVLFLLVFFPVFPLAAQQDLRDQQEQELREKMFPDFRVCTPVFEYPVYHPDDLWDYIDGAADNYLNYHFLDLHIAEYTKLKGKKYFKVEVYHMASPLYAFGIYSSERSPDYHFIPLGTQGFMESSQVFFLKGPYYVKVISEQQGSKEEKFIRALANLIEDRLEGTTEFPPELQLFPDEGKVENSERFIASDFLGHEFFDSVFTAEYQHEGKEFAIFLSRRANAGSARNILAQFYQKATGKVPSVLEEGDRMIHDGYNGNIYLIWKGDMLFGFQNIEDQQLIRSLAADMLRKLSKH